MIAQCPNNRIRILTPSGIRMSQPFITDVEDHRMKTAVEPAEKPIQLAVFRPHRRHTIPAIQLLLKDLAADLGQMLKRFVLDFPLRQEVNRWLPSEVFQCQLCARWIHSVQPFQEWLRGPHYDRRTIDHIHRGDSGGGPVVVVEDVAQSFEPLDNAGSADMGCVWENQLVAQTLMVALAVVMGHEVLNSCPQGAFSKQNQPFQTGFLDAAHKSLGVSVQIRTSRWQLH